MLRLKLGTKLLGYRVIHWMGIVGLFSLIFLFVHAWNELITMMMNEETDKVLWERMDRTSFLIRVI